ncbi:WhiB family transcriptional regulator [Streptomyces sp. NPDC006879]|uniref:WhiB family transcriptional regulator n=1 Tax=Streptomyces sp. NPDC006879 TaxID=3364767 RepID=UPI0036B5C35A
MTNGRRWAPDTVARPGEWQREAACASEDPEVFFETTEESAAKQICRRCPVLNDCWGQVMTAEAGQRWEHRSGVVAGMNPVERALLDPKARGEGSR